MPRCIVPHAPMNSATDHNPVRSCGRLVRWLLVPVACAVTLLARGEDAVALRSPSLLLAAADAPSKPAAAANQAACAEAGIRSELLLNHGRLLPDGFPLEEMKRLATLLRSTAEADASALEAMPDTFPK